ncbi:MAG: hypothetical protein AAF989_01750 [Planctomycetota bacterium]
MVVSIVMGVDATTVVLGATSTAMPQAIASPAMTPPQSLPTATPEAIDVPQGSLQPPHGRQSPAVAMPTVVNIAAVPANKLATHFTGALLKNLGKLEFRFSSAFQKAAVLYLLAFPPNDHKRSVYARAVRTIT